MIFESFPRIVKDRRFSLRYDVDIPCVFFNISRSVTGSISGDELTGRVVNISRDGFEIMPDVKDSGAQIGDTVAVVFDTNVPALYDRKQSYLVNIKGKVLRFAEHNNVKTLVLTLHNNSYYEFYDAFDVYAHYGGVPLGDRKCQETL